MSRPKVLIDGIVFESKGRLGIWRMFYEIIRRTSQQIDYTILLSGDAVMPIPEGVRCHRWRRPPAIRSRRHVFENLLSPVRKRRLSRQFPDAIWHSTFFSLDPREGCKSVVSVYDMISEACYDIGPFLEQRVIKSQAMNDASRFVAISEATRRQAIRFYPECEGRTDVIHLGAEHLGSESDAPEIDLDTLGLSGQFAFFVGGRYAYKNFSTVVRALGSESWPSDVQLCVAGSPFDSAEQAFIDAQNVGHRIIHAGFVDQELLASLYSHSACFIFPSVMEGFGIPIVEAQIRKTVPVLSDIPVFREIGGSGAFYFDPHCPESLARGVTGALKSELSESLRRDASENVQRFSWEQSAAATVECYRSLWSMNENASESGI